MENQCFAYLDPDQLAADESLRGMGAEFRMTAQMATTFRQLIINKLTEDSMAIVLRNGTEIGFNKERSDKESAEGHQRIRKGALEALHRSEIVLWQNQIFYGAINGWQAFEGVPCAVPDGFKPQLWLWDSPLSGRIIHENVPALLLGVLVTDPYVTDWPPGSNLNVRHAFAGLAFAVLIIDDLPELWEQSLVCCPIFISEINMPLNMKAAETMAAVEFLRLPFVQSNPRPAQPRAERRRLEREGRQSEIATIRVVTLRKAAGHHSTPNPDINPKAPIEWSCHWMVRGHWRKQYLPSTGGHRPTWINPFVKGDDSKPFHAPSVVYRASR